MATKNFSFTTVISALVFLVGCSNLRTRSQVEPRATEKIPEMGAPQVPESLERPADGTEFPPPQTPSRPGTSRSATQVGVILGAGGVRAYAHVGVLQEWTKMKVPVQSIVGIEMGALVGAIYAQKAQPFDVEWQLMKLKSNQEIPKLLSDVFKQTKTEDFKVAFSCPAFNLTKAQSFMMNRGPVVQMLPYCLPAPPLMKPHSQNISSLFDVKTAADYLRSKGATFIVYVHVLGSQGPIVDSLESDHNILWSLASYNALKQAQAVDMIVQVPVGNIEITDWGKRREAVQKGLESGQSSGSSLLKKIGM